MMSDIAGIYAGAGGAYFSSELLLLSVTDSADRPCIWRAPRDPSIHARQISCRRVVLTRNRNLNPNLAFRLPPETSVQPVQPSRGGSKRDRESDRNSPALHAPPGVRFGFGTGPGGRLGSDAPATLYHPSRGAKKHPFPFLLDPVPLGVLRGSA